MGRSDLFISPRELSADHVVSTHVRIAKPIFQVVNGPTNGGDTATCVAIKYGFTAEALTFKHGNYCAENPHNIHLGFLIRRTPFFH